MKRLVPIFLAAVVTSGALSTSAHAQEFYRGGSRDAPSSNKFSTSANGRTLAYSTPDGATIVLSEDRKSVSLAPVSWDGEAPRCPERSLVSADGSLLLTFRGRDAAIRAVPGGETIWKGRLDVATSCLTADAWQLHRPEMRLGIVINSAYHVFALEPGGDGRSVAHNRITFAEGETSKFANYISSAAFAPDGTTLYLGSMDGDIAKVSTSDNPPRLLAREQIFPRKTAVDRLACADECRKLVAESARTQSGTDAAIVDATNLSALGRSNRVVNSHTLWAVGPNRFVQAAPERRLLLVTPTFEPISSLQAPAGVPMAGFYGGLILLTRLDREFALSVWDVTANEREQKLVAERERVASAERAQADSTLRKQQSETSAAFRKALKPGTDSHCGLVVERRNDIALVETMIGQKWLKVAQLYPPGMRPCRFVNGVYQDP